MMKVYDTSVIKNFEGLRLEAYIDIAGIWTIGYGDTGPDVKKGLTITKEEAERRLRARLVGFEGWVNRVVAVPLTQPQFDALVSLIYNIGPTNFKASTLLKKLNAKDYKGAADQFLVWNKARVKGELRVVKGLDDRRKAERKLFLGE